MRLLFELSGEHPNLPAAEVRGAVEGEGGAVSPIAAEPGLLALETDADPGALAGRIALARAVDRILSVGTMEDALRAARDVDLEGQTFSVRGVTPAFSSGAERKPSLEAEVGAVLGATGRVDLERPRRRFRLVIGDRVYLTELIHRVQRTAYEGRRPQERLHALPISLHPRLARALVNLSRVPRGRRLHDPFCGTGGIVIEAALMGAEASGSDLQEAMVSRCRDEVENAGAAAEVFQADVGGFSERVGPVDAIATDPPYGRSTTTAGEPIEALYRRAFEACAAAVKPGGRLAVVLPAMEHAELATEWWTLSETHALRVHRSLTRHFCVFRPY